MTLTRRHALGLGFNALAGIGIASLLPRGAMAQDEGEHSFPTDNGEIVVHPVSHASFVMRVPGAVVYVDPVGGAEAYEGMPAADLVLVTHEHGDHFDVPTLTAVAAGEARLVTNPAVFDMLPAELQEKAEALANGASGGSGDLAIDAVPAYNTTEDRLQYHPQGRDNGYVLTVDGRRIYIAGDTEDIPEMRALEGIDIAFVPMNLPYTMDEAQAASGVAAFAPAHVFPYHYSGSDIEKFAALLADEGAETEVVRGAWY